jgi:hypothetical protein
MSGLISGEEWDFVTWCKMGIVCKTKLGSLLNQDN